MTDKPSTPPATPTRAREPTQNNGVRYVAKVIGRDGFEVSARDRTTAKTAGVAGRCAQACSTARPAIGAGNGYRFV